MVEQRLWRFVWVLSNLHDDVIKWKHSPLHWPFMRGIHWSLVDSPHTGQWRGALMFSLICAWTNSWANNQDAGDLRRHCGHYDVDVMFWKIACWNIMCIYYYNSDQNQKLQASMNWFHQLGGIVYMLNLCNWLQWGQQKAFLSCKIPLAL